MKAKLHRIPKSIAKGYQIAQLPNGALVAGVSSIMGISNPAKRRTTKRKTKKRATAARIGKIQKVGKHRMLVFTVAALKKAAAARKKALAAAAKKKSAKRATTKRTATKRPATKRTASVKKVGGATCHSKPRPNWVRAGATKASDYAFPRCFAYPVKTHGKVRRALVERAARRFNMYKSRYTPVVRRTIERNIAKAASVAGVDWPSLLESRKRFGFPNQGDDMFGELEPNRRKKRKTTKRKTTKRKTAKRPAVKRKTTKRKATKRRTTRRTPAYVALTSVRRRRTTKRRARRNYGEIAMANKRRKRRVKRKVSAAALTRKGRRTGMFVVRPAPRAVVGARSRTKKPRVTLYVVPNKAKRRRKKPSATQYYGVAMTRGGKKTGTYRIKRTVKSFATAPARRKGRVAVYMVPNVGSMPPTLPSAMRPSIPPPPIPSSPKMPTRYGGPYASGVGTHTVYTRGASVPPPPPRATRTRVRDEWARRRAEDRALAVAGHKERYPTFDVYKETMHRFNKGRRARVFNARYENMVNRGISQLAEAAKALKQYHNAVVKAKTQKARSAALKGLRKAETAFEKALGKTYYRSNMAFNSWGDALKSIGVGGGVYVISRAVGTRVHPVAGILLGLAAVWGSDKIFSHDVGMAQAAALGGGIGALLGAVELVKPGLTGYGIVPSVSERFKVAYQGMGAPFYQAAAGMGAPFYQAAAGMGAPFYQAAAGMGEYYKPMQGTGEYYSPDGAIKPMSDMGEYYMDHAVVQGSGDYEVTNMFTPSKDSVGYINDGIKPSDNLDQAFNIMEAAAGIGSAAIEGQSAGVVSDYVPTIQAASITKTSSTEDAGIFARSSSNGIFS